MAVNFYSHFGLDNSYSNEYDTDVMLEFEDSDRYKEYKEFFYDVLPEFEKFGHIVQFKVRHWAYGKQSICILSKFKCGNLHRPVVRLLI